MLRDLSAIGIGFVGANALFALQRYLVQPTMAVAVLLSISAVSFVIVVACYAAAIARAPRYRRQHPQEFSSTRSRVPSRPAKSEPPQESATA